MENRITRKVDTYLTSFKEDVKDWFDKNEADIAGPSGKSEFLKFIFDYNALKLSKEDFSKRKRIKNTVPCQLRCCAKRANGEQCTRRRKDSDEFCGTHIKGTPYGKIVTDANEPPPSKKREIWVQEIKGIQYFIDNESNVYFHDDILGNKHNPLIIAHYSKVGDTYSISQFIT
jgi:hypothetical protein